MNKKQFGQALQLAEERADAGIEMMDLTIFDGFGLADFDAVTVTLERVADLIRYQAGYIFVKEGGSRWDAEALEEIKLCGQHKFNIEAPENEMQYLLSKMLRRGQISPLAHEQITNILKRELSH